MHQLIKISLLLVFIFGVLDATLVVDDGNTQMQFRAPFIYFGQNPFNITAPLALLSDYDSCEPVTTDLTGKIAISPAYVDCPTSETELGLGIRSTNILQAKAQAVVFIMKNDGIDRSFASANVGFLSLDIAILIISLEDGKNITAIINSTKNEVIGRVVSDDIPVLDVGSTPWHIVLMTIGLTCDLLALTWTILQLKNHFYSSQSAAISRIALILLIIGCVCLSCERILTFVYIFGHTFYLDLLTGFMAMGVILVTFASTFISLYWNTLLFPHKKRQLESRKIFIPLLCFFSSLAIIYVIMLGLGLLMSITVLQYLCACLLAVLALYFVVSGMILFKSMKTYFTAIINRKKVVKRSVIPRIMSSKDVLYADADLLRVGLVLAGISLMLLLVAVALASPAPYLADQTYYWLIRVFINLFSATSAAALAFLFRTRTDDPSNKSSKGHSSSNNTTKSVGPVV